MSKYRHNSQVCGLGLQRGFPRGHNLTHNRSLSEAVGLGGLSKEEVIEPEEEKN